MNVYGIHRSHCAHSGGCPIALSDSLEKTAFDLSQMKSKQLKLVRSSSESTIIRGSIVVSNSACHPEDPGSIPGRGDHSSAAKGTIVTNFFTCIYCKMMSVYGIHRSHCAHSEGCPIALSDNLEKNCFRFVPNEIKTAQISEVIFRIDDYPR